MTVKNKMNNYHFMHLVLEGVKKVYLSKENKIKVNIKLYNKVPYREVYMIKRRKKSFKAH